MRGLILLLLSPAPAFAQNATVYVENATAATDLISLLREEMPRTAFAETATLADLRAHLSEALRLVIADRNGITMLDRALEGGRDAAVRVAALLIVEARETWRPAAILPAEPPIAVETAVTTTAAAQRGWYVGASGGVGVGMWGTKAQLAFGGSLYFGISDFEIGAMFSIAGAGCACSVRTESLRVEPTTIAVVGIGRWIFWRPLDWIETSIWIGGGYQREDARSRVIAFMDSTAAAQGPVETRTYAGPIGRAGLGAGLGLFGIARVRADFGAQLQSQATVSLPDETEYQNLEGREVERGVLVPWGALTVGLEL